MTFEINFEYNKLVFQANVTLNGKDFLVNLTSPVQYEAAPTMAFTIHDDESMKYDVSSFDDKNFMSAIEEAIKNYIHLHKIKIP